MRPFLAIALVALFAGSLLAGCTGSKTGSPLSGSDLVNGLVPVQARHLEAFNVTGFFSHTLIPGAYRILAGVSKDVPVALPPTGGADSATGKAATNLGLFLPDIPGCDWKAASLPATCRVPVIADVGPYYRSSTGRPELQGDCPEPVASQVGCLVGEGDTVSTQPAHRLGKFLIDNFVPYGYAVAQVSVLGTGDSTSCQDLMGLGEQAGIDAAVTWLGTQPWSNGNVGLIGRSYDGSTPWEAATFGNPHLKTIVPISGLTGQYELMWRNGTAETRGPGLLYALYAAMTLDGEAADATQALCPDYLIGAPESAGAYATGGNNAVGPNTYWSDRYFLDRALANYKGSIYAIHGLQDWNVDPHMMFPTYQALVDHGYEVKGLFGQWNHMYPDRPSEHVTKAPGYGREAYPQSVRYDWAQDLLEWFDHYLKGTGPRPDLHAEVQDNHGAWRIEPTYPPKDAAWQEFPLGSSLKQTSSGQPIITAGSGTVNGATGSPAPDDAPLLYDGAPLADATRISGLAQFPVTVMPLGPGGQVFAQLRDISPNGTSLRLGHAIMDLRYASGGSKAPQPVAPGLPLVAKMEFEVMDAVVPAGHHLQLALTATGEDYLPSDTSASVLVQSGTLRLPTVPLGHGTPFLPPAWSGKASATAQQP